MNTLPTQQRLHELFYCVNGKLIRKVRSANRVNVGDVCNTMNGGGYYVVRIDGVLYKVQRVVWKWYYRTDPDNIIDHIDRNRTNNNIWNLRDVTPTMNSHNNTIAMEEHNGQLQYITIDGKVKLTEYGLEMNRVRCRENYRKNRDT